MTNTPEINSVVYWDRRFADNWESCDGPRQSRFFARLAVDHLPRWLLAEIKRESLTVVDWGCGQGDGTDVLASYIGTQAVTGVDFSSIAIEQAAQRYPAIRFIKEDWLAEVGSNVEIFDVVFSSNTLEHFHKPYDVLATLCCRAEKAIALALPYRELDRVAEHFFSFLPENLPLVLPNGFRLAWSDVVDCRQLPDTPWLGDQVFLVYADARWMDRLKLTLRDCRIDHGDSSSQIKGLSTFLAERDEEIGNLNQTIMERDEEIGNLNQTIMERDEEIGNLNQTIMERDRRVAEAESGLHAQEEVANAFKADADRLHAQYSGVLRSRSWRLTKPLRVVTHFIKYGGFTSTEQTPMIEKDKNGGA